jgi:ankyrin repeat protein
MEQQFKLNHHLIKACHDGNTRRAKTVIKMGADVNCDLSIDGFCDEVPIMIACMNGNLYMIDLLVEKGADINCLDKRNTPFLIACDLYKQEGEYVLRHLIEKHNVNRRLERYSSFLDTEILNFLNSI